MNQQIDDPVAYGPDWYEYVEAWYCWHCGGKQIFKEYDSVYEALLVRCEDCGEEEWCSTEPDLDAAYDRD